MNDCFTVIVKEVCLVVPRSPPRDPDCLSNSRTSRLGEKPKELFHRAGKPTPDDFQRVPCVCSWLSGLTFTGSSSQHRFLQPIRGEVLLGGGSQALW